MQIEVNGKAREIEAGTSVAALLAKLQLDPRYLAVERNRMLVPRSAHAETTLTAGDRIEVVTLVGGG
jgi:thiamine biosynthesis protein ThiS